MKTSNAALNDQYPLAACPRGSLDNRPEADWYIRDLSGRFLAAHHIGDERTMRDCRNRLEVHQMVRLSAGGRDGLSWSSTHRTFRALVGL